MTYKEARDKAAEEQCPDFDGYLLVTPFFKAGADWALTQSPEVLELYIAALNMHSCVNADPCESELEEMERLGKALQAWQAAKESVK